MAAASLTSSSPSYSSSHLLHHLLKHPKPPPIKNTSSFFLLRKPICIPAKLCNNNQLQNPLHKTIPFFTSPSSSSSRDRLFSSRSLSYSFTVSSLPTKSLSSSFTQEEEEEEKEKDLPLSSLQEKDDNLEEKQETEEEIKNGFGSSLYSLQESGVFDGESEEQKRLPLSFLKDTAEHSEEEEGIEEERKDVFQSSLNLQESGGFDEESDESEGFEVAEDNLVGSGEMGSGDKERPVKNSLRLTVKEKKELASYAHSLGKKLKCQLVGKSGVTDTLVSSFVETLEKNELLKIKIHRTCPGELEDVIQHLEEATGSVVVGQIGRTVIVYRPSLTKLKEEEKKKQVRATLVRKSSKFKPASPRKEQAMRPSGRGRRGASRVQTP